MNRVMPSRWWPNDDVKLANKKIHVVNKIFLGKKIDRKKKSKIC